MNANEQKINFYGEYLHLIDDLQQICADNEFPMHMVEEYYYVEMCRNVLQNDEKLTKQQEEYLEVLFKLVDEVAHLFGLKSKHVDYRTIILEKYLQEYEPATRESATEAKTSEQIMLELRPTVEISTNEISATFITLGYTVGFEDGTPLWQMQRKNRPQLPA